MVLGGFGYAIVFLGTLGLSLLLTPVAFRIALRHGLLDHPGEHKVQPSATPYLGGLALLTSFSVVVVAAGIVNAPAGASRQLVVIIGLAMALSVVGLVDDLRGLGPVIRIVLEVVAAIVLYGVVGGIELFHSEPLDAPLTIFWVVAVVNAFNLLDNMDGLSAGVAAIAALSFFSLAVANGQFLVAVLSVALVGCAAGFLRHNFHPARIYMGDAGSLFLGFVLAVVGIKLRFDNSPPAVSALIPVVVLGVPLLDMALVVVTRLVHGRSPFQGGRDHTSHRLVFLGLRVPVAVSIIYVCGAGLGWLGIVMARLDGTSAVMLVAFVLAFGALSAIVLAAIPVYGSSPRRRWLLREIRAYEDCDEDGSGQPSQWSA